VKHSRFQYCYECTPLCHSSGSASPVHLLWLQVWDRPQQDVRAELTAYRDKDCYTSSRKFQVMSWLTRMIRWNRLANYIIYWRACPQSTRVIIYTPGPVSADFGILTTHTGSTDPSSACRVSKCDTLSGPTNHSGVTSERWKMCWAVMNTIVLIRRTKVNHLCHRSSLNSGKYKHINWSWASYSITVCKWGTKSTGARILFIRWVQEDVSPNSDMTTAPTF
jgi:hypothetical protein